MQKDIKNKNISFGLKLLLALSWWNIQGFYTQVQPNLPTLLETTWIMNKCPSIQCKTDLNTFYSFTTIWTLDSKQRQNYSIYCVGIGNTCAFKHLVLMKVGSRGKTVRNTSIVSYNSSAPNTDEKQWYNDGKHKYKMRLLSHLNMMTFTTFDTQVW